MQNLYGVYYGPSLLSRTKNPVLALSSYQSPQSMCSYNYLSCLNLYVWVVISSILTDF